MQLYAKPGEARTQRVLTCAKINEIDVEITSQCSGDEYVGKIPVLDTGKGCIFGTTPIARYLARIRPDIGLYGQNFLENGEVDSWVEFCTNEIEIPICTWTYPLLGVFPDVPDATIQAKIDVKTSLDTINKHLLLRTYMVGHKITLADIHLASILQKAVELGELTAIMSEYINLQRWYNLISNHPSFVACFGGKTQGGAQGSSQKKDNNKQQNKQDNNAKQNNKQQNNKQQNNKQQNDKRNSDKNEKKKSVIKESAPPAPPTEAELKAKKLKAVLKEGGKRGVEVEGVADMGGLEFFNLSVFEPEGDLDMLKECVTAMNAKSDPKEEERRGGAGEIGKMVFSAGVEQLAVVCHVPTSRQGKTDASIWLKAVLKEMKQDAAFVQPGGKTLAFAVIPKSEGKFPIKMKDDGLVEANKYLRSNGLFPEDDGDDDDDEFVFGDEDFPEC